VDWSESFPASLYDHTAAGGRDKSSRRKLLGLTAVSTQRQLCAISAPFGKKRARKPGRCCWEGTGEIWSGLRELRSEVG